jgi:hypothetical protein
VVTHCCKAMGMTMAGIPSPMPVSSLIDVSRPTAAL